MAEEKKKSSTFGVGSIGDFFNIFTEAAKNQTAADTRMQQKVVDETKKVSESAARYNQAAQTSLEEQQRIEADRAEAARMAEGNLFDRISLIGAQALNPRAYTREGRTARTAELSQGLAFHGQVHNVQIAASEAKVSEAKAQNALDTLGVQSSVSAIRAQVEAVQLAQQGIQASETLRALSLSEQQLPMIQKALTGPIGRSGKISIGGFEYTATELREREKAMVMRDQLALLSPQATDPDFAMKLRVSHEMQLSTMSLPELEKLKSQGYILPNGQQVESSVWDYAYKRQNDMYVNDINRKITEHQLTNQVPERIKAAQSFLQGTEAYVTPGSPLAVARSQYLAAVGTVAAVAKSEDVPEAKMLQLAQLDKAEQLYVKAIESEATKKAGGDKEVAGIYLKQMTGQPVSPDEIGDVMRKKYVNYGSFGELLPTQMATSIRNRADRILQERRLAASKDFMSAGDKTPDKEMREQAFNEAYEMERNNVGTDTVNAIDKRLGTRTDHPAAKVGMVPAQMDQIQRDAFALAVQDVGSKNGLTHEQIEYLKAGNAAAAGLKPEQAANINAEINRASAMAEYEQYNKMRPGLGSEVLAWYQRELPITAEQVKKEMNPLQRDMAGETVSIQTELRRQDYQMADKLSLQKGHQEMITLSTGVKKPENSWMLMLNTSRQLENSQKQTLYYQVIMPAIQQARSQGMDDQKTSAYVFEAMNSYQTTDPTLATAIKKIQRELPELLDNFEGTWAAAMMMNQRDLNVAGNIAFDPTLANQQLKTIIPWAK